MTFDKKKWVKENKDKMKSYRDKYKENNPEKHKKQMEKYDKTKKDKEKARIRAKTNYHNEKTGFCNDCNKTTKTEFHHISYNPNLFIELCKKCHVKRHKIEEDLK